MSNIQTVDLEAFATAFETGQVVDNKDLGGFQIFIIENNGLKSVLIQNATSANENAIIPI